MGKGKVEEGDIREVNRPRSCKVRKDMVKRVAFIPNAMVSL